MFKTNSLFLLFTLIKAIQFIQNINELLSKAKLICYILLQLLKEYIEFLW